LPHVFCNDRHGAKLPPASLNSYQLTSGASKAIVHCRNQEIRLILRKKRDGCLRESRSSENLVPRSSVAMDRGAFGLLRLSSSPHLTTCIVLVIILS
jgi:hypothetical protein